MRRVVLGFSAIAAMVCATGMALAANEPVSPMLIRLHDDLRLTPDQDAAWHDYVMAVAPDPNVEARHRATQELLPMVPTPRRIALIEATMQQDDLDFRKQGEAVKAFYGKLTPAQQKVFDRDTLPTEDDPRR
ncbi:MAG: Spy/CpxP family protein refolding chaperone [Proteobacteria bacterium]|nr:Spy/CpxP family protein refolding chaperone [Pseudomonadota bacterium]